MPIELENVRSGHNLAAINNNFQRIEQEWDEKLDRLTSVQGNQMEQDLDMNGRAILNARSSTSDPDSLATINDLQTLINQFANIDGLVAEGAPRQIGDGIQTVFQSSASSLFPVFSYEVVVNGAQLFPGVDFTTNGLGQIIFEDAPAAASNVDITFFRPSLVFGVQGPSGPQGVQGPAGPRGDQGIVGPTGEQGVQGPQGVTGPQGDQGERGERGLQGNQGIQGEQGPVGPQGDQGNLGPVGATGEQGIRGPSGPQGAQGDQGAIGPQGIEGPVGPQGIRGPQGSVGPSGPQGDVGAQGAEGDIGPIGPRGVDGPQGIQGVEGPVGPTGEQGDSFSVDEIGTLAERDAFDGRPRNFTYYAIDVDLDAISTPEYTRTQADGTQTRFPLNFTPAGPQSIIVTLGGVPQGPDMYAVDISGDNYSVVFATAPAEGVMVVAREFSGASGVGAIYFKRSGTSGDWSDAIAFGRGPRGDQGPRGIVGPQGPIGDQGPIGIQGPRGITGVQGPTGQQGVRGEDGPEGPQGPTGDIGPEGTQGPQGIQGPQGPQGDRGVQGDQGGIGPVGGVGPEGPQGERGPQGVAGPQGPVGEQGLVGETGDTGDQGPAGIRGPQGLQGDRGPVGPQGPQGIDGVRGPQGQQGIDGNQGPQGNIGPTGSQGPIGPTGLTGNQGPDGDAGENASSAFTRQRQIPWENTHLPNGFTAATVIPLISGDFVDAAPVDRYLGVSSVLTTIRFNESNRDDGRMLLRYRLEAEGLGSIETNFFQQGRDLTYQTNLLELSIPEFLLIPANWTGRISTTLRADYEALSTNDPRANMLGIMPPINVFFTLFNVDNTKFVFD